MAPTTTAAATDNNSWGFTSILLHSLATRRHVNPHPCLSPGGRHCHLLMPRKGLTLVELVIVLFVLAVVAAVAVPSYQTVRSNMDMRGVASLVAGAAAAGRQVAAAAPGGYAYPDDLASRLSSKSSLYVSGPATGYGQVSVWRVSAVEALYASPTQAGWCVVVYDRLDDDTRAWGVDRVASSCDAQAAESSIAYITGSASQPSQINIG